MKVNKKKSFVSEMDAQLARNRNFWAFIIKQK